jgi:hypothetical protein
MGSEKEMALADDKTKRAPQDAKLISLEEDYEVQYWTLNTASPSSAWRMASKPLAPRE